MILNTTPKLSSRKPMHQRPIEVALPEPDISLEQDAEWCVVRVEDKWKRIRFHDYRTLFSVPKLYERVIYDILKCRSPQVITDLLNQSLKQENVEPRKLRALDLGAGNGIVGELLANQGAELIVGVDIIEEAAEAAERDRPGVYDEYEVLDMTSLTDENERMLRAHEFNCLTCVAALGFGDIPTGAFTAAYNLIVPDGWIAFNIKEEFLSGNDDSGFAGLVRSMIADSVLDVRCKHRYQHRLGTDREPIHYVAIVGQKQRDIS